MLIFLNETLVPEDKAKVSVFDHGFLYGDGIYETMIAYQGVIFRLDAHLKRLQRSASLIGLRVPYTNKKMKTILYDTLGANKLSDAYIRLTVSRGKGALGLDPSLCPAPSFVVIVKPFKSLPDSKYRKGVKIIVSSIRRNIPEAVNPEIKSLNFLNNILAKIEAKKKKAVEALMLNTQGFITEGTTSNIFIIKKKRLITPSLESGILNGITRQTVLQVVRESGINAYEKRIRSDELYRADEVFITNSSLGIMPVSQADGVQFPKKRDVTEVLMEKYKEEIEREIKKHYSRRKGRKISKKH